MDAPPQVLQEVNRILCLHNLCPLLLVPLAVAEFLETLRIFANPPLSKRGCGPFLVMTDEVVGGGGGGGCRDGGDGAAAA